MLRHDSGVISLIQQLNNNREEIADQIQKLREISIDINTNLQNSKKALEQAQAELDDFSLKFSSITSDQKTFQQVIDDFQKGDQLGRIALALELNEQLLKELSPEGTNYAAVTIDQLKQRISKMRKTMTRNPDTIRPKLLESLQQLLYIFAFMFKI